jgi:hypothetical protein
MNPNTPTIAATFPILAEQGQTWVLIGDIIAEIAKGEEFEVCFDAFTGQSNVTAEYEVSVSGHTLYIEVSASANTHDELTSRSVTDWVLTHNDTNKEPTLSGGQVQQLEQAIIKNITAG